MRRRSSSTRASPSCTARSGLPCAAKSRRVTRAMIERAIQILLLVVLFGGWQAGVHFGVIDRFFFPAPLDILAQVWHWIVDPDFYRHVGITVTETVVNRKSTRLNSSHV